MRAPLYPQFPKIIHITRIFGNFKIVNTGLNINSITFMEEIGYSSNNNSISYLDPFSNFKICEPVKIFGFAVELADPDLFGRSRGTELFGSFNPNVIAELFWEQSQPWAKFAESHIDLVSYICEQFYDVLLKKRGAKDVASRIWSFKVRERLEQRKVKAREELRMLIEDLKGFPINYNHYYTDNLHRTGEDKLRTRLNAMNPALLEHRSSINCSRGAHYDKFDLELIIGTLSKATREFNVDMEKFSCEEALDCLHAIYKVIERHMFRDFKHVFSLLVVAIINDTEIKSVAFESSVIYHQRKFLVNRISKFEESRIIFRNAVGIL
ncbi:uncharacterized protein PgNI_12185 [Pyricularia grisea]|uniref:GED domain-containing protein n=1 Tax=Pyricularia grisea TaxID=148305 RepID=A0A6P8AQX3_PYRGI|nr:uncharacterized protein PgNI_12185 [Pyricularia grisea]TLD04441.1 hypothetical protein PgNI_12185 [Pyricularia grisea]